MSPNFWWELYIAVMCGWMGYITGETIGYGRGIKSAANIWQESVEIITKVAMEIIKRKKD